MHHAPRPATVLAALTMGLAIAFAHASFALAADDEALDLDSAEMEGGATVSPPIQLDGGGGTFSFATATVAGGPACVIMSADGPAAGETEPLLDGTVDAEAGRTCTASASGTYANLVCGTGVAAGSGTLDEGDGSDVYTLADFHVSFFAGVGVLFGAVVGESESDGTAVEAPVAGVVTIAPTAPLPGAPACVDHLAVAVALATTA
jgi:hypothetical protein